MQIDPHSQERARLSRRLSAIEDKETKRQLRRYRTQMTTQTAIASRNCSMIAIRLNGVYSTEPDDLMSLLHTFLDQHNVAPCHD